MTASRLCRTAALLTSAFLLGTLLIADGTAVAATPPSPASNLALAHRYDHTLVLSFQVPAGQPGATAVVRLTAGATPAPTPTQGYAVAIVGHTATARPLTSNARYTFAVWIRSGNTYSSRRTISGTTLTDVTPPADLSSVGATVKSRTAAATPAVAMAFHYRRVDIDQAGLRIVRNTKPTTTGGQVIQLAGAPPSFIDTTAHQNGVRYYYWTIPYDTSGHYAAHYVGTSILMNTTQISGTYSAAMNDSPTRAVAFDLNGTRVDTLDNYADDGSTKWHMDLPPGKYTVCQYAPDEDPQQHFHPVAACAVSGADGDYVSADWAPADTTHFPSGAEGAVDTTTGPATGVNLTINYY